MSPKMKPPAEEAEPIEAAPTEPAPPPAPPPPPPAAEMLTAEGWAARLGQIVLRDARLPQSITFARPEHAAGDALYGWSQHAYHFQAPADAFAMSEATYRAALRSAMEHPAAALVEAAIPPSQRERLSTFKPKAATGR